MMKKIGIHKLYSQNPIVADRLLWDRETDPISRRGFLGNVGLISMSTVLGGVIPFAKYMPQGLIPAALAQSDTSFEIPGKEGLIILNDRPINAETPAHLLDDNITPAKHLFVRNNEYQPKLNAVISPNPVLHLLFQYPKFLQQCVLRKLHPSNLVFFLLLLKKY